MGVGVDASNPPERPNEEGDLNFEIKLDFKAYLELLTHRTNNHCSYPGAPFALQLDQTHEAKRFSFPPLSRHSPKLSINFEKNKFGKSTFLFERVEFSEGT